MCERRGRDGGGEQEEENSKTWLDPTDLESLVSTTCGKKFPTKHLQRIYSSAANNNWLDLSDDLISGRRRSIDRSGFLTLLNTQCLILTIKSSHYVLELVTATKHESIGFFEKWVFKKMTFIIQYNVFIKFSQLQRIPSEDKKNESKTLQTTKRWSKKVRKFLCEETIRRDREISAISCQNS